ERQLQPFLTGPLRAAVLERLLTAAQHNAPAWPADVTHDEVLAWLQAQAAEQPTTARLFAAIAAHATAARAPADPGRPAPLAALQRLWSVEGGRGGAARWTLEVHLDALGYGERARRSPALRRRVAREVELLTRLELAVYAPDGRLRAQQPLITVGTKYSALHGTAWMLEGMELRVNEWLYRGVRDPKTGALGADWYPAPVELAQIDHVRFPYALALGLVLPMRWRWDLGTRDHCALTGAKLLATAGIRYSRHDPGRAWAALRRNL